MAQPLITIGIPTYNRPEQLKKSVSILLRQVNDKCKIVIRDNASTYKIEEILTKDELHNIEFIRNDINIGGDANILSILSNCTTKWCWVLGDDDYLVEDAVKKVLNCITSNPDTLYINFSSTIERKTEGFENFTRSFKYNGVFGNSFFISSCVYNMNLLKESLPYYYASSSSCIGQILFVLKHLEKKGGVCLFTKEELFQYHSPASWDPIMMVMKASIIYVWFRKWRKELKNSFFFGITQTFLHVIFFTENKGVRFGDKFYVLKIVCAHYGALNTLYFCKRKIGQILVYILFPEKMYNFLYEAFKR